MNEFDVDRLRRSIAELDDGAGMIDHLIRTLATLQNDITRAARLMHKLTTPRTNKSARKKRTKK